MRASAPARQADIEARAYAVLDRAVEAVKRLEAAGGQETRVERLRRYIRELLFTVA